MPRRLIHRRGPTHHTGTLRARTRGTSVQLAHYQEQAPDFVYATQILGQLVSILFPSSLVLLFRHVSRHEATLESKKILRCCGDLISKVSDSLSERFSELRHLICHRTICSA